MSADLRIATVYKKGMIELQCARCGQVLDTVPDDRTAIFRASEYLKHVCPNNGEAVKSLGEERKQ